MERQALIDAGLKPGTKSIKLDELAQARRTIEELEAEHHPSRPDSYNGGPENGV